LNQAKKFNFIPLFITLPVIAVLFWYFFPKVSTTSQIFHDIIIENVAKSGYNKSAELNLFWILLVLGIVLLLAVQFLIYVLSKSKTDRKTFFNKFSSKKESVRFTLLPYATVLLFPNLFHFVIFGTINKYLLFLAIFYIAGVIVMPDFSKELICFSVLFYYALMGIFTVTAQFVPAFSGNPATLSILGSTVVFILLLLFRKKQQAQALFLRYLLLGSQLPIFGIFALYFVDEYLYKGELITLRYAPGYYGFFIALIALLLFFFIKNTLKCHKEILEVKTERLISVSTIITIYIYNSFSACPMYAQPDQHHHGEQMIPWQQVMDLGQSLYGEYTPLSGLFPMVIGGIQHLLLGGTATDYSPAVSIMMVLFCAITMYLIHRHVGGMWALAFSVLFCLPSYNRQYMVLPVLLLLMLPALITKKRLWILTWIFSCFLAGLYYPLYGAGVLLGTLPFGIVQLLDWLKEKDAWLSQWKKPASLLQCIVVFVPILLAVPLLLRMLKHTLTYSSQTVLADGITLYGQSVPDFFLTFLTGHEYLRSFLYFSYRFLLPMLCVWLFVAIMGYLIFNNKKETTLQEFLHSPIFYGITSGIITLCISYTYTLVRADVDVILSRTSYIACAVCGIFLPVVLISGKKYFSDCLGCRTLLIAFCVSLPMMMYGTISDTKFPDMWVYPNGDSKLMFDDTAKLYSYYEVPELLLKSEDTGLSETLTATIGDGFMVGDQLSYLTHYESVIEKCSAIKEDMSYLGFDGQGFYYYNDVKACSTGFIQAAKSYEAQQTIIKNMEKQRPVVFLMEPDCTYYVYYWMHANDYVYCKEDACFYPSELFEMLYPGQKPDDYRRSANATDFGLVTDSFGRSLETLLPLMTDSYSLKAADAAMVSVSSDLTPGQVTFTLDAPLSGKKYDMLCLKLDTQMLIEAANQTGVTPPHQLQITFHTADGTSFEGGIVSCQIGNGTLLIPMGMNPCWLLTEDIATITIDFGCELESTILADSIKEATLYELRK